VNGNAWRQLLRHDGHVAREHRPGQRREAAVPPERSRARRAQDACEQTISVVLPALFGPITPTISPGSTVIDSARAGRGPRAAGRPRVPERYLAELDERAHRVARTVCAADRRRTARRRTAVITPTESSAGATMLRASVSARSRNVAPPRSAAGSAGDCPDRARRGGDAARSADDPMGPAKATAGGEQRRPAEDPELEALASDSRAGEPPPPRRQHVQARAPARR